MIVWDPGAAEATVKVCWTWGAALKLELPAWLASIVQLPAAVKLTTPPEMEQLAEVASRWSRSPEAPSWPWRSACRSDHPPSRLSERWR